MNLLQDKEILTEVLGVMSRSMETDRPLILDHVEQGINTIMPSTSTRGTGILYPRFTVAFRNFLYKNVCFRTVLQVPLPLSWFPSTFQLRMHLGIVTITNRRVRARKLTAFFSLANI